MRLDAIDDCFFESYCIESLFHFGDYNYLCNVQVAMNNLLA